MTYHTSTIPPETHTPGRIAKLLLSTTNNESANAKRRVYGKASKVLFEATMFIASCLPCSRRKTVRKPVPGCAFIWHKATYSNTRHTMTAPASSWLWLVRTAACFCGETRQLSSTYFVSTPPPDTTSHASIETA